MRPIDIPLIRARSAGVVPTGATATVTRCESARAGGAPDNETPSTTIATMADPRTARSRYGTTFAKFTFFKLDPAWQRRDPEARGEDKREFLAACEDFAEDRSLRAYSTVGTRGDTDLLLLAQSPLLEDIHTFHVV